MLSKDNFRQAAGKFKQEAVYVPDLGGSVIVCQRSAKYRDDFEESVKGDKAASVRARLVACYAADENGQPLFSPDDVAWLGDLPASTLEPIVDAAMRLNGMRGNGEPEKNSVTIPG